MNPRLALLQPYPFARLRALFDGITPPGLSPIRLSIGEPQHATPHVVMQALADHVDGLAVYPTTPGLPELRETIAAWLRRRYALPALCADTQVLPVNGSREALFAFAQAAVDSSASDSHEQRDAGRPLVVCPNPFYQIYEGAAILAGAETAFLNQTAETEFALDFDSLSAADWSRVQLVYVCSPANPTGKVTTLAEWQTLFELADRHQFAIASDECYGEIYPEDGAPPLGALEAAVRLGRHDFRRLVVFGSLSKRSNVPGLRSGYVAGDASLLEPFLLYRTYHGCAMSLTVQHASIAAWRDEAHVQDNRVQYAAKFSAVRPLLDPVLDVRLPEAGFYLWAGVPGGDDERCARELFAGAHVTVLPGSYLGREAHGRNPGRGYIRIALVPEIEQCVEAARRIARLYR
ncbi:MAG: succinyldiaminopimelate transaminase [Vicinamibacterales bacterium]